MRRLWAGVRRVGGALWFILCDRELTILLLYGVVGFFVGCYDRVFKKEEEKW